MHLLDCTSNDKGLMLQKHNNDKVKYGVVGANKI